MPAGKAPHGYQRSCLLTYNPLRESAPTRDAVPLPQPAHGRCLAANIAWHVNTCSGVPAPRGLARPGTARGRRHRGLLDRWRMALLINEAATEAGGHATSALMEVRSSLVLPSIRPPTKAGG